MLEDTNSLDGAQILSDIQTLPYCVYNKRHEAKDTDFRTTLVNRNL